MVISSANLSRRLVVAICAVLAFGFALACGGEGRDVTITGAITPVLISSDLAIGPNRVSIGLLNGEGEPITSAKDVVLRFYKLEGTQGTLKAQANAKSVRITRTFTETHADGKTHTHEAGEVGVYIASGVIFDSAGDWGLEVMAKAGGKALDPVRMQFGVLERAHSVTEGAQAPRTTQRVLKDVKDIAELDTSDPPNPDMHSMTIAEAVSSGRPTVIAFATPAFCTSRICGPAKQIVDEIYRAYKGRVNFVHIEPYDLEKARSGEGLVPVPFFQSEWGLQTEPWVFVIDSAGKVSSKFEGVVAKDEIETALKAVLN